MTAPTDDQRPDDQRPDQPDDDTQADFQPGLIVPPPGPASAGQIPAPAPPPLGGDVAGDPDTATQPAVPAAPESPVEAAPPPAISPPPLRAMDPDPNRPASEWREPPWFPPDRSRSRSRGPSTAAIVVGLILLAIGLYYFVDRTLGIDLPGIRWGSLWPVVLILLGLVIVVRALSRR